MPARPKHTIRQKRHADEGDMVSDEAPQKRPCARQPLSEASLPVQDHYGLLPKPRDYGIPEDTDSTELLSDLPSSSCSPPYDGQEPLISSQTPSFADEESFPVGDQENIKRPFPQGEVISKRRLIDIRTGKAPEKHIKVFRQTPDPLFDRTNSHISDKTQRDLEFLTQLYVKEREKGRLFTRTMLMYILCKDFAERLKTVDERTEAREVLENTRQLTGFNPVHRKTPQSFKRPDDAPEESSDNSESDLV